MSDSKDGRGVWKEATPASSGPCEVTEERKLELVLSEIAAFRREVRSRDRVHFGFVLLALGLASTGLSFNYTGFNQLVLAGLGLVLIVGSCIYLLLTRDKVG